MGLVAQALFAVVAVALGVWWVQPPRSRPPEPIYVPPDIPAPTQAPLPTTRFTRHEADPAWRPTAPEGFTVELFASAGLEEPSWLYELSNGDVLITGEQKKKVPHVVSLLRGLVELGEDCTSPRPHFAGAQRNAARAAGLAP
jgi:hypothetical protein